MSIESLNLLPRKQTKAICKWLYDDIIILLVGSRQVGKTSLMHLLKGILGKEGISKEHIFFFDLEDINLLSICNEGPDNFINFLESKGVKRDNKYFIFLDEIQYLENPSNFLKIIVDHYKNLKLIASGSSSLEIRQKFKDSLAGRKIVFEIFPLDFSEFLIFKGKDDLHRLLSENNIFSLLNNNKIPDIGQLKFYFRELTDLYEEYVIYGGYPRITLEKDHSKKEAYLQDIYNSYVRKDIKDIIRIDNVSAFNRLIQILALQIGNLVNLNELSRDLGIARETLERYLFLLENTFIIKLFPPFYTNKRKEIVKMPKIFFDDTGLRNLAINNFAGPETRPDKGQLTENAVFSQLTKNLTYQEELFFWRTQSGNEVDFILGKNHPIPIEMKYQTIHKPQVPSGIRSFIKDYSTEMAIVLTRNSCLKDIPFNGSKVFFYPCWMLS